MTTGKSSPTPGRRWTSDRRKSRLGAAARSPIGATPAGMRAVDPTPGPLAFAGPGAVLCPACLTGLDPRRRGAGSGSVPKHARYGWPTNARGRPPCRGWVESLPGIAGGG